LDLMDILKGHMNNNANPFKAVCILSDQPDLDERFVFFEKRRSDFQKRKEALDEEYREMNKVFWGMSNPPLLHEVC